MMPLPQHKDKPPPPPPPNNRPTQHRINSVFGLHSLNYDLFPPAKQSMTEYVYKCLFVKISFMLQMDYVIK